MYSLSFNSTLSGMRHPKLSIYDHRKRRRRGDVVEELGLRIAHGVGGYVEQFGWTWWWREGIRVANTDQQIQLAVSYFQHHHKLQESMVGSSPLLEAHGGKQLTADRVAARVAVRVGKSRLTKRSSMTC